MQTIQTRYIGPTNTKGARIKATHSGGFKSVTVGFHSEETELLAHKSAANKLRELLAWDGKMIGGDTADGMVWVFATGEVLV